MLQELLSFFDANLEQKSLKKSQLRVSIGIMNIGEKLRSKDNVMMVIRLAQEDKKHNLFHNHVIVKNIIFNF